MYKLVNKDILLNEYKGDEEVMLQVIETFLLRYQGMLADLSTAVEKSDGKRLTTGAKTLHGELSAIGGQKVSGIAADMEKSAQDKQWNKVKELLPQLQTQVEAFAKEINSLVNEVMTLHS